MIQLLSLLLTAAPPTPIQSAERLEPIGWSADQHTVALRVFFGTTHSELEPCPGYIDAAGKPFDIGLAIVVLRDGVVLHSFVIQAPPFNGSCTDLADAKKALEAAKKKLEELGIDRSAPGTVLAVTMDKGKATSRTKDEAVLSTWKETWRAKNGDATPLEIVATMNDTFAEDTYHTVNASFAWKLRSNEAERSGTLKLRPFDWSLNMAGGFSWRLHVFASPNGENVVAFIRQSFSNMRGGSSISTLLPLDAKK